jgi:hypothetical protein
LRYHITFAAISVAFVSSVSSTDAPELEHPPPASNPAALPRWEDEILNGYIPYHQLTTDDFPVKDGVNPEAAYWVQPFVHYYYNCISKMAHGGMVYAYVKDWTVFSGFNKNLSGRRSKFRKMKDELPYAQAILDINELYARRLAALQPGEFPSGSGGTWAEAQRQLENRIEMLCQIQMKEMRNEAETLAKATNNGQNRKRVGELSAAIKKRLAQLPPANGPSPTATPATVSPPIFIPPPALLSPKPN